MIALFDDENKLNVFLHEDGHFCVRQHIALNEDKDVVVAYNPSSTLYPEWLPRETGKVIVKKDGTKEKEVVFDIYNGRSGWYIFEKKI